MATPSPSVATASKWDQPVTVTAPPAGPGQARLVGRRGRARPPLGTGRVSRPTYNERVSPPDRRRTGDPTLDAAAEAAPSASGTAFTDLAEATAPPPEEPAWMRDAPVAGEDPAAPAPAARPGGAEPPRAGPARSRSSGPSTPSRPAR